MRIEKIGAGLLFSLVALGSSAYAEESPKLSRFFAQKLNRVQAVLAKEEAAPHATADAFVLQDLNIDLAPEISFGMSGVLNLTIAPEVDFVLTPVAD